MSLSYVWNFWSWHTYEMHSVFYGKSGVTKWDPGELHVERLHQHLGSHGRQGCWESGKNLSPWNVRFQSSRINSWITFGLESSASWEGNIHEETLMHFIYFADLLIIRENNSRIRLLFANLLSVSGWLETGTVQRIRNPRSSGIWWSLSSGTTVRGGFYE
jgi:hypothetical protein